MVYLRIAKAASTQRGRGESHRVGEEGGGSEESDEPPSASDDEQTVRSTVGHPYYVVGRGWVHAKDLQPGDELRGSKGEALVVVGLETKAEEADHYNFEVQGWHTYFVSARADAPAVWVHNACGPGGGRYPNLIPDDVPRPAPRFRLEQRGEKWVTLNERTGTVRSATGRYTFIQEGNRIYVNRASRTDHIDLSRGRNVDYAGELQFSGRHARGSLRWWSNRSGHYQPSAADAPTTGLPMGSFRPVGS